jgi:probable HAF family extracellular repeat protein
MRGGGTGLAHGWNRRKNADNSKGMVKKFRIVDPCLPQEAKGGRQPDVAGSPWTGFIQLSPSSKKNLHSVNSPSIWLKKTSVGLCAAAALVVSQPVASGQTYGVTQLPTLGGTISHGVAINNAGVIAGDANLNGDTVTHATSYFNGTITDLGSLGGAPSTANGVSSSGVVAGTAEITGNAATHVFIDSSGTMTDLGTLGGTNGVALGVNSVGMVIGNSGITGNGATHAFLYSNGAMADLGTFGGTNSTANAINDSGVIVGNAEYVIASSNHHAFSYSTGAMTDLGTLGGALSNALAINASGHIAGNSQTTGGAIHAFSYFGGTMTDLGTIGAFAGNSSADGINSSGVIVGNSATASSASDAFVYSNGVMTDLNSLVNLPGVTLTRAPGINDLGQIVAKGSDNRAYLLTPLSIHFVVTTSPSTDAGYPMSVTVAVVDGSNNLIPGYSGVFRLTSSDGSAVLPAGSTLSNGSGTFVVTLKTAGAQTITATDTAISSITGTSAQVTVNGLIAPTIGEAPVAESANLGANAAFWVVASGTQLKYQWKFNAASIPGATSPILLDVGVLPSSAGTYSVTITNLAGSVTTVPVMLTVNSNNSGNPLVFTGHPASQTIASGSTVAFSVTTGPKPGIMVASLVQGGIVVTYQWFLNGMAIQGATDPIFVINGATPGYNGTYACLAIDSSGALMSNGATLNVVSGTGTGRLINLSCRVNVGTGASQLIAGYVVGGQGTSGTEPLLIRASGPSLAQFGVAGVLADPRLQLNSSGGVVASNDGWGGAAAITSAAASVGAFPWTSASSHDSALLETLAGGSYTAEVTGSSGDTGVALAEIYDATPAASYTPSSPRLVNISARAPVGTGANVLIAGFVIDGTTAKTVLIRGAGPALGALGVPGALPDPQLHLYQSDGAAGSTLLGSDTGWGGDTQIASAAASVGAFSWGPVATPDSALLVTLPPGAYTAVVSGASGDTGIGLIEVYEVP